MTRGGLLFAGTHSDAGKTGFAAGNCRRLARQTFGAAPVEAQNTSPNSTVRARRTRNPRFTTGFCGTLAG